MRKDSLEIEYLILSEATVRSDIIMMLLYYNSFSLCLTSHENLVLPKGLER